MMIRLMRTVACAAVLMSSVVVGCDSGGETPSEIVREGDLWPALTVNDCAGQPVDMSAFIAAHDATYVTFGAQWCSACQEEAPIINTQLVDGLAGKNVGVVQILIENQPGQSPTQALCDAWATDLEARYTVLVDVNQAHLPKFFGGAVATLPLHLIATKDGLIRFKKLGALPTDIKSLVEGWLPK